MGISKRKINLTARVRLVCLSVIAALAVSYVRHGVEHHRASWGSAEEFFISWFIHWVALSALTAAVAVATICFHKFFLGYEYEDGSSISEIGHDVVLDRGHRDRILELYYHVLVVTLVAAISIAFLAHYTPTEAFGD